MSIAIDIAATLLFAAHLLAVNLAMAGPILCVWLEWRGRRGASPQLETPQFETPSGAGRSCASKQREGQNCASSLDVERMLAVSSLVALPIGLTFGGGLLAILWQTGERPYLAALAMIPRDRLAFGAGELGFYLAAMFAYWMLRGANPRRRWPGRLLAIAAASNLMLHFPPLFAMMAVLSHRPEMWARSLDRGLYHSLLFDPEVASRVVHVWLAAVATGGIFVMWLAARRWRAGEALEGEGVSRGGAEMGISNGDGEKGISRGGAEARRGEKEECEAGGDERGRRERRGTGKPGEAMVVGGALWRWELHFANCRLGLWALVALPDGGQAAWSGDFVALTLLGAGVAASLALLQQLAGAAMGDAASRTARRAPATLALTVVLMCGASRHLRQAGRPPAVGDETPRAADKLGQSSAPRAGGDAL